MNVFSSVTHKQAGNMLKISNEKLKDVLLAFFRTHFKVLNGLFYCQNVFFWSRNRYRQFFFLPVMICNSFFWETLRVESKICKDMTKMTDTKCDQMSVCVPVPSQCCLYEDSLPNIFRLKALNKQKCSLKCLIPCKKKEKNVLIWSQRFANRCICSFFSTVTSLFFLAFIKIKVWWCLQNTGMWQ